MSALKKNTPLRKVAVHTLRFANRMRLRNRNFSLITNTCIGGIVYHELGLQFLSPTINCGIRDHEQFFTFCNHLRHYLSLPLNFVPSEYNYPVATLRGDYGPVTIFFSHYKSREQASAKWEERKRRVNWDNIVILMDGDNCTTQQAAAFNRITWPHKVIFTTLSDRRQPSEFAITHPEYRPFELLEYGPMHHALRWYETLDLVHFLNTGNIRKNPLLK